MPTNLDTYKPEKLSIVHCFVRKPGAFGVNYLHKTGLMPSVNKTRINAFILAGITCGILMDGTSDCNWIILLKAPLAGHLVKGAVDADVRRWPRSSDHAPV
jgi:hypothetical protein